MKIKEGKIGDAKGCLKLQEGDKENYWELKDFKRAVRNEDVVFVVAEENDKILGYALGFIVPTKRNEALIHETRVDKEERGKGMGTRLVKELCKKLFSKGVKEIFAEIDPNLSKFYIDSCKFKKSHEWIEVKKLK